MGRLLKRLLAPALGAALTLAASTHAGEYDLSLDLRAVSSDATTSRLAGGLGKLRYDTTQDGLRFGYLRLGYRGDVTPTLRVTAEAVAYGDHDVNPLDLTELFAEWRPIPVSAWRSRLKVGAFYPEISMENRMRGWRSPYTLSFSAINTWVGEELRTIGAEYSLDWLGMAHGHGWEFSSSAALFGWNDPAGTVLATRGWGLHDRQGTLFGRYANGAAQPFPQRTLFYDDMDKRAGYYLSSTLRYRGLLELRGLHYDNRARLTSDIGNLGDGTWRTYFDSIGVRWTPSRQLTVIAQWLHGVTLEDPDVPHNAWTYHGEFLLASWKQGDWRYSGRYDRFAVRQFDSNFFVYTGFNLDDTGHAWTFAADRALGEHWHATVEYIKVDSDVTGRIALGQPTVASERQLQLALRYDR